MNRNQLSRCKAVIGVFIGAAVAVSVSFGNIFMALAAVFIGTAASYICSRRVSEVINDEMVYRITEKASRRAFQVFTPAIAFIGLALVVMRDSYPGLYPVGLALAYSACGILVLYLMFYSYYSRGKL